MKRSRVDSVKRNSSAARNKDYRFFALAGVFLISCIAFTVFFIRNQVRGPQGNYDDENLTVRIETVAGERGNIYDRNGKLLAGNASHYNLIFEYGSMPDTRKEINDSLAKCLLAIESSGNIDKLCEDFFPLTGSYPELEFVSAIYDSESKEYQYYQKFLNRNELDADIEPNDVALYLIDKYSLNSNEYPSRIKQRLMRIYYDMERINFGYYQYYTVAEGFELDDAEDMALVTYIGEHRPEGATMIKSSQRVYFYEDYAKQILGSVGKITAENIEQYADYPLDAIVGISGCENAFESYLRGSDGKRVSKYDSNGNLVQTYYDPEPVIGKDIYLTIDIDLQIAAEDALEDSIEDLEACETGALTAVDPSNGEVLVLASRSTESVMNFALQGTFAPGSTYKVGSALAALEEGFLTENTTHTCNKVYPHLGGPTCLGTHGDTDVHKAIEVSCNIFFYYLGHEWGLENITNYTTGLGLGVPTGIELGEKVGIVASEAYCSEHDLEWSEFDDATGAIGQSKHAYTPLQIGVYMATLSNGGTRYSAHILKEIKDSKTGETVYSTKTEVLSEVNISSQNYEIIMEAMRSVVTESDTLSRHFANVSEGVAGKTGTAETGKEVSNALFAGFAPYDSPEIAVSCVLEEGDAGYNAAAVCAKVLEAYFADKNLQG